uniref:Uncharacterized protein n=1 Tax=Eutreptiella gymnastica TaxID=73025 RepID=A0A7S4LCN6_9EUGL|mmetsp:Transcript_26168/g.44537  ORF Transcript_26168/g.44537 Transcript_26168/m.44537 type:complete len:153 (+) Transcript_26168:321-779(+)
MGTRARSGRDGGALQDSEAAPSVLDQQTLILQMVQVHLVRRFTPLPSLKHYDTLPHCHTPAMAMKSIYDIQHLPLALNLLIRQTVLQHRKNLQPSLALGPEGFKKSAISSRWKWRLEMASEESKLPLMPRTNVLKNTQAQQRLTARLHNLMS